MPSSTTSSLQPSRYTLQAINNSKSSVYIPSTSSRRLLLSLLWNINTIGKMLSTTFFFSYPQLQLLVADWSPACSPYPLAINGVSLGVSASCILDFEQGLFGILPQYNLSDIENLLDFLLMHRNILLRKILIYLSISLSQVAYCVNMTQWSTYFISEIGYLNILSSKKQNTESFAYF